MRAQTPWALLTIVAQRPGQTLQSLEIPVPERRPPFPAPPKLGAIGTVGGGFVLATGIALLLRSPRIDRLIPATAWLCVPTFVISGVIYHYAGWPITAAGIAFPLLLVALHRSSMKAVGQAA